MKFISAPGIGHQDKRALHTCSVFLPFHSKAFIPRSVGMSSFNIEEEELTRAFNEIVKCLSTDDEDNAPTLHENECFENNDSFFEFDGLNTKISPIETSRSACDVSLSKSALCSPIKISSFMSKKVLVTDEGFDFTSSNSEEPNSRSFDRVVGHRAINNHKISVAPAHKENNTAFSSMFLYNDARWHRPELNNSFNANRLNAPIKSAHSIYMITNSNPYLSPTAYPPQPTLISHFPTRSNFRLNGKRKISKDHKPHRPIPPNDYICRLCNTPGHWLKDCILYKPFGPRTEGNSVPPANYVCRLCCIPGHWIEDCRMFERRSMNALIDHGGLVYISSAQSSPLIHENED